VISKIKVPEGMLEAGMRGLVGKPSCREPIESARDLLEAALLWQRENAPVPTREQLLEFNAKLTMADGPMGRFAEFASWWIRRMYDAPEPEAPSEIADLRFGDDEHPNIGRINRAIDEAFRRGQRLNIRRDHESR
jgi:hypothetical protein